MQVLTACSPASGRIDVFLGVDDGGVWHSTFNGTWGPWRPLGCPWPAPGTLDADWLTATSSAPGRIELLALSPAGELWYRECADDGWGPWTPRGTLPRYSGRGGFTAAADGPGELHVFHSAGEEGAEIVHRPPEGGGAALHPFPGGRHLKAVAAGPGRFDLFAAHTHEAGFLHGRYQPGRPVTWEDLGHPPGDEQPSTGFAATQRDIFVVAGRKLWHRKLDGPPSWEDLGGDLLTGSEAGTATPAAVSWGAGRTDVFALWAGTAVMHRSFGREWSDWQVLDVRDAATGTYHVLRPQDLVSLRVSSTGLSERRRPDGTVELVAGSTGGRLTVDLPPQHITEAVLSSGTSAQARMAGPSRLHFAVSQGNPVLLTADGLLGAMERLPLVTTPGTAGQEVCRLELPWRLLLALQTGARCSHRSAPVTSADGVTELWHSRISGPGADQRLSVKPYQALPDDSGFATPLGSDAETIAQLGVRHPDQPVSVDRLIVSAFGAWFSASVDWPELGWSHDATMGRDVRVRVLKRGALFPFGHLAAYVEVTHRQFEGAGPALAVLRKKRTLIITEPVRHYGIGAGGRHERKFPFQHVTIEPRQVTDLDAPVDLGNGVFWPKHAGETVMFTVRAQAGHEVVSMWLPLLFTADTASVSAATLDTLYSRGPLSASRAGAVRPTASVGRRIPLAMQTLTQPMADAEQEVQSMTFGGVAAGPFPNGVRFHPQVTQLEVGLPAVRQLLGPTAAVPVTFSNALVQTVPGAPPPDALLDLLTPKALNFSAAGTRTGLLAAPNMAVNQISRSMGPVVGGPLPTPAQLFSQDATLFGVVPLRDLISTVTGRPTIVWSKQAGAPSAVLTWKERLTKPLAPFYPGGASSVSLEVLSQIVGGRPALRTTGEITDFTLQIPSASDALVVIAFKKVRFTANSGENLSLTFDVGDVRLGGKLEVIRKLGELVSRAGSRVTRVEVSATQIKAAYTISVPDARLLVFSIQNLVLEIGLTLSLTNRPVVIDFAFGTRERPFLVTVSGFGGGGYLELGVGAGKPDSGLQRLVGGIEFGAAVAMDFGIASGEVHVFGGVVFVKRGSSVEITGYLRMGGSVSVLGLIRVSVELTMSLSYDSASNRLSGSARLVITVDLTFWSTSVTLECHKSFEAPSVLGGPEHALPAGAAEVHPSSVEAALGPDALSFPWRDYCTAFAGE